MLEMRKYVTIKTCVNLKNYNQGNEIDLAYNRGILSKELSPVSMFTYCSSKGAQSVENTSHLVAL